MDGADLSCGTRAVTFLVGSTDLLKRALAYVSVGDNIQYQGRIMTIIDEILKIRSEIEEKLNEEFKQMNEDYNARR